MSGEIAHAVILKVDDVQAAVEIAAIMLAELHSKCAVDFATQFDEDFVLVGLQHARSKALNGVYKTAPDPDVYNKNKELRDTELLVEYKCRDVTKVCCPRAVAAHLVDEGLRYNMRLENILYQLVSLEQVSRGKSETLHRWTEHSIMVLKGLMIC